MGCPRIAQAFLSLECTLENGVPLEAERGMALLIGRVRHLALGQEYARGLDAK